MIRILAAGLVALAAVQPAAAQFYPDRFYEDRRPPRYYDDRRPPRDYRDDRPYRGEFRERRARLGGICITSRGNCRLDRPAPFDGPCRCFIPGFGPKRGNVR